MFTIIFSILAYQALKSVDEFTINGFVVMVIVIADYHLITKLAEIIF